MSPLMEAAALVEGKAVGKVCPSKKNNVVLQG